MTDLKTWDFETDPHNPQPLIYPVCGECGEAYDYRRAFALSEGYIWAWLKPAKVPKGCRHTAPAVPNKP